MSHEADERTPYEIIEQEKEAYLEELPEPDPDWPVDVRVVQEDIQDNLFEFGLRVQDVLERCGLRDNSIYTRFRFNVGNSPKDYILLHRMRLASRLLKNDQLTIGDVAMGVGYGSPSAFSNTFKSRVGTTPGRYRENSTDYTA